MHSMAPLDYIKQLKHLWGFLGCSVLFAVHIFDFAPMCSSKSLQENGHLPHASELGSWVLLK